MASRELDIDVEIDVDGSGLTSINAQLDAFKTQLEQLDTTVTPHVDLDSIQALTSIQNLEQQLSHLDNSNVDIDIAADFASTSAQIQALEVQINSLDANDINVDIDVRDSLQTLTLLRTQIRSLERTAHGLNVEVDAVGSLAMLDALRLQVESIDNIPPPVIDVNTQFADAMAQLTELENQVQGLDGDDIFVDVDIRNATSQMMALRAHILELERQAGDVNVDLDTSAAHLQIAALHAHMRTLGAGPQITAPKFDFGDFLSPNLFMSAVKLTAIGIALPAVASAAQFAVGALGGLGYTIGVVGAGALALGSAVAVAGAGLVGFGATAISSITALYEKNAKLTDAQKALKKSTDSVVDSWQGLQKNLQPYTFSAIETGVKSVNRLLDYGQPVIKNATRSVDELFKSLNQSLKGQGMKGFFSYLERAVGPLTTNIGKGLGNALKGVTNTMVALEPLTSWVGQGFENAMSRFAKWTDGFKNSDTFSAFMDSAKTNLSSLGGILKNATKGVGKFFGAFDVSATDGLDWLEQKMKDFNKWAGELGENEGFQDMLNDIAHDGPEIAKTIGNVTDNVIALTDALSGIGRNEDGSGGIWSWLSDLTDPDNLPEISFEDIFKGGALGMGLEALKIDIDWVAILGLDDWGNLFSTAFEGLGDWFDGIELDVSNWFKDLDFGGVTRNLTDGLSSWFDGLDIGGKVAEAFSGMGDLFSGLEINIGDWLEELDLGRVSQSLVDGINNWLGKLNLGDFSLSALIDKFEWPDMGSFKLSDFIDKFEWPDIGSFDLKELVGKFEWPKMGDFSWSNFIDKFSWSGITSSLSWGNFIKTLSWSSLISPITWSSFVKLLSWGSFIKSLSWGNFVKSISWGNFVKSLSWGNFVKSLSWTNFVKSLSWTNFVKTLSWSSFVKSLSWGNFIKAINWSNFIPDFSWPSVSMPDMSKYIPGFSSGLGRVQNDMVATIHKDEAVLPAHQASLLRNLGVIQGEGRYPGLDMGAIASFDSGASTAGIGAEGTSHVSSNNTTSNQTSSKSASVTHNNTFNVTISGADSKESFQSFRSELEDFYASLSDEMDLGYREV